MEDSRDARFAAQEAALGYSFEGEIKIGGNYVSTLRHGDTVYVSGQVPRVGSTVVVTGRAGADVIAGPGPAGGQGVRHARAGAAAAKPGRAWTACSKSCASRSTPSPAADFTQQSEVADAASELLHTVLGNAGTHTRTSVGVAQLPKNAAVELDLIAAVTPD